MFVTSEGTPARVSNAPSPPGNLIAAEQAAFEVAFVPLADARALVELYAEKGDRKFERAALKYNRRFAGCLLSLQPWPVGAGRAAVLAWVRPRSVAHSWPETH